jgi:hypothetical protein
VPRFAAPAALATSVPKANAPAIEMRSRATPRSLSELFELAASSRGIGCR